MEPWQFVSENRGLDKTHDACPLVRKHRRKLTPHTAVYGIIFNLTVHSSVKQDTIDQLYID